MKVNCVCGVQNGVSCKLIAEISTGFRLLSIAATYSSSGDDKSHVDEDEEQAVAEADCSGAVSDSEDMKQLEESSDETEGLLPCYHLRVHWNICCIISGSCHSPNRTRRRVTPARRP